MMVDEMPIRGVKGDVDALTHALAVRTELQKGITSEAWLFEGE